MTLHEAADRENVRSRAVENEMRGRLSAEEFLYGQIPLLGPFVGPVARCMTDVGFDQGVDDLGMRARMIVASEASLHFATPLKRKRWTI